MDKKSLFLILFGVLVLASYPLYYVSAQIQYDWPNTISVDYKDLVYNIENTVGFIFGALAVICFILAGILFLTAQGQPEKLQLARSAFIWGVVGVVVGIVAFSIIAIVSSFISSGS